MDPPSDYRHFCLHQSALHEQLDVCLSYTDFFLQENATKKEGYCTPRSHSECSGILFSINQMWQENNTTNLKGLVTNDYIMIIALHFIFNLENILSQQSSIVGDMSL